MLKYPDKRGRRNERRKWFGFVCCIIIIVVIVSMEEFQQDMYEFEKIVNCSLFELILIKNRRLWFIYFTCSLLFTPGLQYYLLEKEIKKLFFFFTSIGKKSVAMQLVVKYLSYFYSEGKRTMSDIKIDLQWIGNKATEQTRYMKLLTIVLLILIRMVSVDKYRFKMSICECSCNNKTWLFGILTP